MRRMAWLLGITLTGCGGDTLDDLNTDFDFELSTPAGPAFFFPVDESKDWTAAADSCALKQDGSMWCWHVDYEAQKAVLQQAKLPSPLRFLTGGGREWCGLDAAGSARCWYAATKGTADPATASPQLVEGVWEELSMGNRLACGIDRKRELSCWGALLFNTGVTDAATGDPIIVVNPAAPYRVTEGTWNSVSVSSGFDGFDVPYAGAAFCGLDSAKTLWCYDNSTKGYPNSDRGTLQAFGTHAEWKSVHVGIGRVCGLTTEQTLECYENTPSLRKYEGKWISFSMSGGNLCGVQVDHSLWCWGRRLGTGEIYSSREVHERARDWESVWVGPRFTCAIKLDRSMVCLDLPGWMSDAVAEPNPVMVDANTLNVNP